MKAGGVELGKDRSWLVFPPGEGDWHHYPHITHCWGSAVCILCPSPSGTLLVVYKRLMGHPLLVALFGPLLVMALFGWPGGP